MSFSPSRRCLLVAAGSLPFTAACTATHRREAASIPERLAALEASSGGRLGVAALNTADGSQWGHRADERFAMCSTFKVIAASAILARSAHEDGLLQRRIAFAQRDLVAYSPVTQQHAGVAGMTIAQLCAAALQYSDNTAGNLLVKIVGGPWSVTAFARAIGDRQFRLDRWETELNSAIPGDPRDTTTPAAMATSLQRLALGTALAPAQRETLIGWMGGNTTGAERIRAGVPVGWYVADKTGGGDYGTANDVAVLWPLDQPPIVLAVFHTQAAQDAKPRNDVLAAAAQIVAQALVKG